MFYSSITKILLMKFAALFSFGFEFRYRVSDVIDIH